MARMIPSYGPSTTGSYTAEPTIYRLLAQQLPNTFTVIHSVPWLGQAASEIDGRPVPTGELDFFILHPVLGILAIEVKGGRLAYDRNSFVLLRTGKRIDPVSQVRRGVHTLARSIGRAGGPFLRIGYAVAFPESDMRGQLIPPALQDMTGGKPESICIDQSMLPNLGNRVVEIMRYWQKVLDIQPLTKEQVEAIVQLICPIADYSPRWRDRIHEDMRKWLILTPEQKRRLDQTASQQRVVLNGRAGTGKTLLASARARQLDEQGKYVLFLVYNVQLASQLTVELEDTSIEVLNFHQLCRQAATHLNLFDDISSDDWYKVKAPQALEQAIRLGKMPPYDALVLDESQVFHPTWLHLLAQWFEGKPIMACCDETQVFSFEEATLPEEIARVIGAVRPLTLTINMRSPRAVFERLQEVSPTSYEQMSLRGEDSDTLTEYAATDPLRQLHTVILDLHKEGIPAHSILVIYCSGDAPTYKRGIEQMVGKTLSVYKVRGVEYPVVIVYSSVGARTENLLCAYTRATSRCIAIYPVWDYIDRRHEGAFHQLLEKRFSREVEKIWPPAKKFHITPIVTESSEIGWSHDWGGWIASDKGGFSIPTTLWQWHISCHSKDAFYRINLVRRTIFYYIGNTPFKNDRRREWQDFTFVLGWCDHCNWWARLKRGGSHGENPNLYYCLECHRLFADDNPLPQVAALFSQQDKNIVSHENVAMSFQSSPFLAILLLWNSLTNEQKIMLEQYASLSVVNEFGYPLIKILTGIALLKRNVGQLIQLDNVCRLYPQLLTLASDQQWHRVVMSSLSAWMQHKWIEKVAPGVYRRLPVLPRKQFTP